MNTNFIFNVAAWCCIRQLLYLQCSDSTPSYTIWRRTVTDFCRLIVVSPCSYTMLGIATRVSLNGTTKLRLFMPTNSLDLLMPARSIADKLGLEKLEHVYYLRTTYFSCLTSSTERLEPLTRIFVRRKNVVTRDSSPYLFCVVKFIGDPYHVMGTYVHTTE